MKNCTDCKHALWDKTEAGRLHPKGGGGANTRTKFQRFRGLSTGYHATRRSRMGATSTGAQNFKTTARTTRGSHD